MPSVPVAGRSPIGGVGGGVDAPLSRMKVSKGGGGVPVRGTMESGEDRRGGLPLPTEAAASSLWAVSMRAAAVVSLTVGT
jgi:hypothetical protein